MTIKEIADGIRGLFNGQAFRVHDGIVLNPLSRVDATIERNELGEPTILFHKAKPTVTATKWFLGWTGEIDGLILKEKSVKPIISRMPDIEIPIED